MDDQLRELIPLLESSELYVETIAGRAHNHWIEVQKINGWKHGKERDNDAKTHPHMVPWHELPLDQRSSDILAARAALQYLEHQGRPLPKPDGTDDIRRKIKMYSVDERENQFDVAQFVKPLPVEGKEMNALIESLPGILAGKDFRELVHRIAYAYRHKRAVIVMMGGHVIKCGLAPIINEMMNRKVITHLAVNGAVTIHDIEFAMMGHSSEWVKDLMPYGKWGMWKETSEVMHPAIEKAYLDGKGMGEGLQEAAFNLGPTNAPYSILAGSYSYNVPVTVHVGIGADVIHQHPQANFEQIGATSGRDFYKMIRAMEHLNDGGVLLNFGSFAFLPEVFSKALNTARNAGYEVTNFTTASFDKMLTPVEVNRPMKNIITRPHIGSESGKGYAITGHHELMIPLLFNAVVADIWGK